MNLVAAPRATERDLQAAIVSAPRASTLGAYAAWLSGQQRVQMAEMNERLAAGDEAGFARFVTNELRATLPAPYAKKVRPSWEADSLTEDAWAKGSLDFRGLHVARPTRLSWLREQELSFHIVKFSLLEGPVDLLAAFPRVACLNLSYSKASDFSALAELTRLQELDLWGAKIDDLRDIGRITKLAWLQLFRTRVVDLSPLRDLAELWCLALCGAAGVRDLEPVAALQNLRALNISATGVTDLAPLARVTKLERLYARDLKPINLDAVHGLKNLRHVDLLGAKVSTSDVAALRAALPAAKILDSRESTRSG